MTLFGTSSFVTVIMDDYSFQRRVILICYFRLGGNCNRTSFNKHIQDTRKPQEKCISDFATEHLNNEKGTTHARSGMNGGYKNALAKLCKHR